MPLIPKIIWQTWMTKDLHPICQAQLDNTKKINPDWTHYLLTDDELDNFVNTEFADWSDVVECYHKLNMMVAKVDFWRYLVLYKYGGVYMDMDSAMIRPLDELIRDTDNAVITFEGNMENFVQWAMIFAPSHPILKHTIDLVIDNIKNDRFHNDILNTTGPAVFTRGVNLYHKKLYGEFPITKGGNETYGGDGCGGVSYRIYGVDYNGHIQFKYPDHHLLFYGTNSVYWRHEVLTKNLLR